MSNLMVPHEAAEWIESWRGHYAPMIAGRASLARKLRHTADEQRRNCEGSRGVERQLYVRSVALLEQAARQAEREALAGW